MERVSAAALVRPGRPADGRRLCGDPHQPKFRDSSLGTRPGEAGRGSAHGGGRMNAPLLKPTPATSQVVRIERQLSRLVRFEPFFACLALRLTVSESPAVETFSSDGGGPGGEPRGFGGAGGGARTTPPLWA